MSQSKVFRDLVLACGSLAARSRSVRKLRALELDGPGWAWPAQLTQNGLNGLLASRDTLPMVTRVALQHGASGGVEHGDASFLFPERGSTFLWLPDVAALGAATAELSDEASRHAKALRLKLGAPLTLFDGTGAFVRASLETFGGRRGSTVTILSPPLFAPPQADTRLVIACAVPNRERADDMVSMLAQLGCDALIPLVCRHSEPRRDSFGKSDRLERIIRSAYETSKRCHRAMVVEDPVSIAELIASRPSGVYGDANGEAASTETLERATAVEELFELPWMAAPLRFARRELLVVIGPEGGFHDSEIDLMRPNFSPTSFCGHGTLRVETAAIASAAIMGNVGQIY